VEATGHAYESVVTAPTATEQGFTTHTCHCGDFYVDSYTEPRGLYGDLNGDGKINSIDYSMLKRSVMGKQTLNEKQQFLADINHDGRINVLDYGFLRRHVMGIYKIDQTK
jgi:hypothetical protein